jgi:phosphate transport system permease protein
MADTSPQGLERVVAVVIWVVPVMVLAFFLAIAGDVAWRGLPQLTPAFFLESPLDAGRRGGIASILVGTGLLLVVAVGSALPLGLATAIFLAEHSRAEQRLGRLVRRSLDVLSCVPTIVFGLFGLAFFCETLRMGWSILAGGLTLACMILPTMICSAEESVRAVPTTLREAAAAVALPRTTTLRTLVLPAAMPGITAGVLLGIGRAAAETAAVMFTAGAAIRMPDSLFASTRSLSYHIYLLAIEVPGGQARAYASGVVLVGLLLVINLVARTLGARWTRLMVTD